MLLFFLPVPPNAEVFGYKENWTLGMENAALWCKNGGNPKPVITWTRYRDSPADYMTKFDVSGHCHFPSPRVMMPNDLI